MLLRSPSLSWLHCIAGLIAKLVFFFPQSLNSKSPTTWIFCCDCHQQKGDHVAFSRVIVRGHSPQLASGWWRWPGRHHIIVVVSVSCLQLMSLSCRLPNRDTVQGNFRVREVKLLRAETRFKIQLIHCLSLCPNWPLGGMHLSHCWLLSMMSYKIYIEISFDEHRWPLPL